MKKTILTILSIVFLICFISTVSYANNEVKNGIHNFTDGIVDGVENLGADVRSRCWCS